MGSSWPTPYRDDRTGAVGYASGRAEVNARSRRAAQEDTSSGGCGGVAVMIVLYLAARMLIMCRSTAEGGRRCPGSSRASAGQAGDMNPALARVLGTGTPEGAARFQRLSALRDSGYTGPVDQDGYALSAADARKSPQQRSLEALAALSLTHS